MLKIRLTKNNQGFVVIRDINKPHAFMTPDGTGDHLSEALNRLEDDESIFLWYADLF